MTLAPALLLALLASGARAQEPLLKERNERPLDAEGTLQALEPWETPVSGFFIRSHHEIPVVDRSTWALVIDGLVGKPLRLTLKDLRRYPKKSLHAVLECSGNGRGLLNPQAAGVPWEKGAVGNAEWSGASLAELLRRAGVSPKARFARVSGMDLPPMPETPAFARSVPIEKLLKEDTLLAWEMNREPLPLLHGGPVRLVLPDWYGQNWIKWVAHITLTEEEDPGFYMKKAYRMPSGEAPQTLRVQSLITRPFPGERVPPGELKVRGKAFSGSGAIARVQLSSDGGKTWLDAKLEPRHADGGWQAFEGTLDAAEGPITVLSRAADAAGNVQPLESQPNPGGYLRNGVDSVACSVDKDADPGEETLIQSRCLVCHTAGLIGSQRLSREGWTKTVAKMRSFGAVVPADEEPRILDYLAKLSAKVAVPRAQPLDYARAAARYDASPRGDAGRGKRVYAKLCANCHGLQGQGDTGPRLAGRAVPRDTFFAVTAYGRGTMPGFAAKVGAGELADLYRFLQRPPDAP